MRFPAPGAWPRPAVAWARCWKRPGGADEAQEQYRRVYLEAPHETWGKQAAARIGDHSFTAPERAIRAMALFDNMRNQDSEAEWAGVLEAPGLTDALACTARYHLAQSVFKGRDRPRAAPLFDLAVLACEKAGNDDLTTKALYQGARCWGAKGDKKIKSDEDRAALQKAAALHERVWREHPQHSYADDARLRQGEIFVLLENDAKVTEAWAGLPDAFATGDQRNEALWRLAFRAWRKGDLVQAEKYLQKSLQDLPREEGWWEAGRTLYWLGRVATRQDDAKAARTHWVRAVNEYPLSFYSLLAFNRLREQDPVATRALIKKLSADDQPERWQFQPRALFASPGFKRALELARLGLGAEAKRELALAGIEVPMKKGTIVTDPDQEELLWVAAVIYDRAGQFALAHFIPRHVLTSYARSYPTGSNRKKWQLAFPRGYADLIEKNTQLTGQPAALEFALVREESGFDPLMESFANAIGLTQLTAPAADRFAGGLPHRPRRPARASHQRCHRGPRAGPPVELLRRQRRAGDCGLQRG